MSREQTPLGPRHHTSEIDTLSFSLALGHARLLSFSRPLHLLFALPRRTLPSYFYAWHVLGM